MRVGAVAAACAFAFSPLAAQDSTRTAQASAVRVFLDCPDTFCDFDYYRTEITFVNWVRDRQFAQVHVLVTTQRTGGGQEYTLSFIGLERFASEASALLLGHRSRGFWRSRTARRRKQLQRCAIRGTIGCFARSSTAIYRARKPSNSRTGLARCREVASLRRGNTGYLSIRATTSATLPSMYSIAWVTPRVRRSSQVSAGVMRPTCWSCGV